MRLGYSSKKLDRKYIMFYNLLSNHFKNLKLVLLLRSYFVNNGISSVHLSMCWVKSVVGIHSLPKLFIVSKEIHYQ